MYSPKFMETLADAREDIGDKEFFKTIRQYLFEEGDTFDIPDAENLLNAVDEIDNSLFEDSEDEDAD